MLAARLADMTGIWMLALVMGLLLGAVLGFLVARSRDAAKAVDLAARASAADERARAAEQRAAQNALYELEGKPVPHRED